MPPFDVPHSLGGRRVRRREGRGHEGWEKVIKVGKKEEEDNNM